MRDLVLYTYWRSSSAFRVRIALAVKGLAYRSVAVNLLLGENKKEDHTARNPLGYVPCLLVDGRMYIESVAILELLEDLYPEPAIYPKEPFARARVRSLVEVINAGTQPLQNLSVLNHLSQEKETRIAWSQHHIARGFAAFEALLALRDGEGVRGRFAYGDTLTAADAVLVPMVYNAKRWNLDLAPYKRLVSAYDAAIETPAVKAAHPDNQPDAKPDAP